MSKIVRTAVLHRRTVRRVMCLGVVTLAWGCSGVSAQAATIIGNLPPTNDSGDTSFFVGTGNSKGVGFTMNAGSDFQLTAVVLRLDISTFIIPVPLVEIYDNNGSNNPGTSLASLSNPVFVDGVHDFTFTPAPLSSLTLTAGSTYWIVLSNPGPRSVFWMHSVPSLTPTGPNATSFGARFSSGSVPPTGADSDINSYELQGREIVASVPEPSSLVLAGLAVLGLAVPGWRCRKVLGTPPVPAS